MNTQAHNNPMAELIAESRKARGLTQKQLSEQLHTSDKAVSKWERGLSYPDILLLPPLAEALGLTTDALLAGKQQPNGTDHEVVNNALAYADSVTKGYRLNINKLAQMALTLSLLVSIFVCCVVDVAIHRTFTWSLIVAVSCVYTWLVIMPPLRIPRRHVLWALGTVTLFTLPYLFVLGKTLDPFVFAPPAIPAFAYWVALIGIAVLWMSCGAVYWQRHNLWLAAAACTVLCIVPNYVINRIIAVALSEPRQTAFDILSALLFLLIAVVLLCVGLAWRRKHGQ